MIKAVVFDLWETLGTKNIPVSDLLQERFGVPKTDAYLRKYEEAVQLEAWDNEHEMAQHFLRAFGQAQGPENEAYVESVFRLAIARATMFEGVHEMLASVKEKGLKVGLLSNTTIFESTVLDAWGITDVFDATVFSWQTGELKPSRAAFEAVAEKLSVQLEEILFIDDGNKNVVAARALGMQAAVFEGVEPSKAVIAKLGT